MGGWGSGGRVAAGDSHSAPLVVCWLLFGVIHDYHLNLALFRGQLEAELFLNGCVQARAGYLCVSRSGEFGICAIQERVKSYLPVRPVSSSTGAASWPLSWLTKKVIASSPLARMRA